jgi:hypothetical protein
MMGEVFSSDKIPQLKINTYDEDTEKFTLL